MKRFRDDLVWSESRELAAFWTSAYKLGFRSFVRREEVSEIPSQKLGVDARLYMIDGGTLLAQEKARRVSWTDILLEFLSDARAGTLGWMERGDQICDWFAYAVVPRRQVWSAPWPDLRAAWLANRDLWLEKGNCRRDGFDIRPSRNEGYSTYSVSVPLQVMSEAVPVSYWVTVEENWGG